MRESAVSATERVLIATLGARTAGYMALERLRRGAVAIQPVAYNGGHAALQAAVAQHASAAFVPLPSVMPYLGSGRVRVLALAEERRHSAIPDVPTTAEMGHPNLRAVGWFGVFAPAALPPDDLHRLDNLLSGIARSAENRETFSGLGVTLEHRDATAFERLLASEVLPL
jgi:tripartite-type tricarboxylate transporter receptor subunit TctC